MFLCVFLLIYIKFKLDDEISEDDDKLLFILSYLLICVALLYLLRIATTKTRQKDKKRVPLFSMFWLVIPIAAVVCRVESVLIYAQQKERDTKKIVSSNNKKNHRVGIDAHACRLSVLSLMNAKLKTKTTTTNERARAFTPRWVAIGIEYISTLAKATTKTRIYF